MLGATTLRLVAAEALSHLIASSKPSLNPKPKPETVAPDVAVGFRASGSFLLFEHIFVADIKGQWTEYHGHPNYLSFSTVLVIMILSRSLLVGLGLGRVHL